MLCLLDDRQAVRLAKAGDRSALAALVDRHYGRLLAVCRRGLGDPELARDAAQQAVLSALLGLERLRDEDRFGAWLIGIGLNVCRSLVRERGRGAVSLEAAVDVVLPSAADRDPARALETREVERRVRDAIAALPEGQRAAVALYYLAGLTQGEIAEQLGTAPGAIKTRLHKARHSLRTPLTDIWKEHFAVPADTTTVTMEIVDIRRTAAAEPESVRNVLILREVDGPRELKIWIGPVEATALAVKLEDVPLPRPWVHEFTARLIDAAGVGLREVRMTQLTDFTFYAEAVLSNGATVDARPSDALALAVHLGAPIRVAEAVLAQTTAAGDAGVAGGAERPRRELNPAEELREDAKAIAQEARDRLRLEAEMLEALRASKPEGWS